MLNRKFLLGTTVIAGLAAAVTLSAPAVVWAQDAATPAPASQPEAEEDDSEVEALIVTGSRIKRTEFTSASPVQIITSENAALQGVSDTADMLQGSTLAAGSPQINSTISSAFVTDGGPGASTISLRGLGANRTLVLLNGRRAGPAGTRGAVSSFDLNVIPQSSIERIEILKDGASSIYGSDAVAGVVNIITKTNRDGWEFEAFASQPFEDGGESYRFNGSWGKTFDRGYISASADYYFQAEQKIGDRDYTNCTTQYTRSGATGQRNDLIDPRTGKFACRDTLWGHLWLYDYSAAPLPAGAKLQFDYDGNLGNYIPHSPPGYPTTPGNPLGALVVPADWYFVDYDTPSRGVTNANHPFIQDSSLIPQVERMTVFINGGFDITPDIEAYGEFLLNRRTSKTNGFRQFWTYQYTSDAFGGGDPFSAGFTGDFVLSPTGITDHFDAEQTVDYIRGVAGVRGAFGGFAEGWDWDIFTQLSRSDGDYTSDVILNDALRAGNYRTGSCVGSTLAVSGKACIDIPWVSGRVMAGDFTDEERAFLFDTDTGNTVYTQKVVEGSVSGNLPWKLPAGPIGAAFGFHIRTDEIEDTPGAITRAGNSWGLTGAGITKGDDTTTEFFGEFEVPIARGLPGIEELTFSASGRWTDVDSYGDNSTYKLGLNWQLTPAWRIRATKGTSFRAPALFELYLANQSSFLGQRSIDPCINWGTSLTLPDRVKQNCAAGPDAIVGNADDIPGNHTGAGSGAQIFVSGGLGLLEAETSDAQSIGIIWTPDFIDLSVAFDYFEIEVNDEIRNLTAGQIVSNCLNSPTYPADGLCAQFDRNPTTHLISEVRSGYLNVASQINRGVDLTLRYQHEFDFGRFTFDSQFTWQFEDSVQVFAGQAPVDNNGDVGDPDFVGNLNFRFDRGDWTANWFVEMVGKGSDAEDVASSNVSGTTLYKVNTEFTAYHSLSLRRKLDTWTITGGVANVFDEAPPSVTPSQVSAVGTSVLASQYDYFGRRAFLSVRKTF